MHSKQPNESDRGYLWHGGSAGVRCYKNSMSLQVVAGCQTCSLKQRSSASAANCCKLEPRFSLELLKKPSGLRGSWSNRCCLDQSSSSSFGCYARTIVTSTHAHSQRVRCPAVTCVHMREESPARMRMAVARGRLGRGLGRGIVSAAVIPPFACCSAPKADEGGQCQAIPFTQ